MLLETRLIHAIDDLETLKGRVQHKGKWAIELLQEGSCALRKGKSHVALDHMERAMTLINDLMRSSH